MIYYYKRYELYRFDFDAIAYNTVYTRRTTVYIIIVLFILSKTRASSCNTFFFSNSYDQLFG